MRVMDSLPQRKMAHLLSTDIPGGADVHHWRMDESSGSITTDAYVGGADLTWTLTSIKGCPIADQNGAPTFHRRGDGGTVYGTTPVGSLANTSSQNTWEWVGDVLSMSKAGCLFSYGSSASDTSPDNYHMACTVNTNGSISIYWEYSSGVDVTATTNAGVITTGIHHVAVRRKWSVNGTVFALSVWVDGLEVYRDTYSPLPDGGANGRLYIGSFGGSDIADVNHFEFRYIQRAMSDDFIRRSARRIHARWSEPELMKRQNYTAYARFLVEDPTFVGGSGDGSNIAMVDIDNLSNSESWQGHGHSFLVDAEWNDDLDNAGSSATVNLVRQHYKWSLAPVATDDSPIANGVQVLDVARRGRIEAAYVPSGMPRDSVPPWAWQTMFEGFISSINPDNGGLLQVTLRDLIAPLQNQFMEPFSVVNNSQEPKYGSDTVTVYLETVLQQILDDADSIATFRGGTPLIKTPTPTLYGVREKTVGWDSIYNILLAKVDQIGYTLRYEWDDGLAEFRLTLQEPDRLVTSSEYTLDRYRKLSKGELNEDNIRNACTVVFFNEDLPYIDDLPPRDLRTVDNPASIAKYGRRWCQIAEEAGSEISTAAEATNLAAILVADLGEPKSEYEVELGCVPYVKLNDYYTIEADNNLTFGPIDQAVIGFKSTINSSGHSTVLTCRAKPASRIYGHFDNIAPIGAYAGLLPVQAPTGLVATKAERSLQIEWDFPVTLTSRLYDYSEIHKHAGGGIWTPDATTLVKQVRGTKTIIAGVSPFESYNWAVVHVDKNRNRSDPTFLLNSVTVSLSAFELPNQAMTYSVKAQKGKPDLDAVNVDMNSITGSIGSGPTQTSLSGPIEHAVYVSTTAVTNATIVLSSTYNDTALRRAENGVGLSASYRLLTPTTISDMRLWIGFFVSSPSADPTTETTIGQGFCLEGTSLYRYMHNGSTRTQSVIATLAPDKRYTLDWGYNVTDALAWWKFTTGGNITTSTASTAIPTSSDLYAIVLLKALSASARQLRFTRFVWLN